MGIRKVYCSKAIVLLTLILYVLFFMLGNYSYGSIILAIIASVLLMIISGLDHGKIYFHITYFHRYMLLFSTFCFLSAIWGIDKPEAISNGITILEILICLSILILYYQFLNSIDTLLKMIILGGIVVMLVIIVMYGPSFILVLALFGQRFPSDFINSNTLGLLAAMCVIIDVNYILKDKKFHFRDLFLPVAVTFVAVSGSRKAFIFLFAGILLLFVLRNIGKKKILKTVFKTCFVIIFLGYLLLEVPMFEFVLSRMKGMVETLMSGEQLDHSTFIREEMIRIGIDQFKDTPLLGSGMGSSKMLVYNKIGDRMYMHNNFVELLASGGIIGFLIYYSMYIYLFINMFRYRAYRDDNYAICLTLLLFQFIMDYGMVSYDSKSNYFYLMIFFIYIQQLKKKKEYEASKIAISSE